MLARQDDEPQRHHNVACIEIPLRIVRDADSGVQAYRGVIIIRPKATMFAK